MTKTSQIAFRKINSSTEVVQYLTDTIKGRLEKHERVLWLLSGGSAIDIEVAIAQLLARVQLGDLSVALVDERYGPVGHQDSNWYQLEQAGLSLPGAKAYPILDGGEVSATTQNFERWLGNAYKTADFKIALLGMGSDGHTGGILTGSPALSTKGLVCSYSAPDFLRVTTTVLALSQLNEAVLYAVGPDKWPQLERLQTNVSPSVQPAQLLKQIPKATVFNDHLGDHV